MPKLTLHKDRIFAMKVCETWTITLIHLSLKLYHDVENCIAEFCEMIRPQTLKWNAKVHKIIGTKMLQT